MARKVTVVRSATDQADTGQTDTVTTPGFARMAIVYLNVTATEGTTPLTDMKFQYLNPGAAAPVTAVDFQWDGITQIAGTTDGEVVCVIGALGGSEDDTGPVYFLRDPLPQEWNIVITLDRSTGDEKYTYTLTVEYMD